ncbi:hypothetical protein L596_025247 [Steinernema carpocapsae]|uniref:Uncharacterized protein n=1 Tax=Steinernema carpocapsae TaxID=34508 RepID=A0A4U5M7E6_STECR|nr:hypothetical protein L596_025247 [Steinernema carpocapsae]
MSKPKMLKKEAASALARKPKVFVCGSAYYSRCLKEAASALAWKPKVFVSGSGKPKPIEAWQPKVLSSLLQ